MCNDNFLPCPFCGGKKIFVEERGTRRSSHGEYVSILFIKCDICGAQSRVFPYTDSEEWSRGLALSGAKNVWNNRASHEESKTALDGVEPKPKYLYFVSYMIGGTVGNATFVSKNKVNSNEDIREIEAYLSKDEDAPVILLNLQILCGGDGNG